MRDAECETILGVEAFPLLGHADRDGDKDRPDWVDTYPNLAEASNYRNGFEVHHPNRKRLMELIKEAPGLNIQELADALDVERTTVKHHIRVLQDKSYVVTRRQGRHRLHFPSSMNPKQRASLTTLRIPSVRAVVEALYRNPTGLSPSKLARRLDVSKRTIRRALDRLRSEDLLYVEADKDSDVAHLHPDLRIVIARWYAPRSRQ